MRSACNRWAAFVMGCAMTTGGWGGRQAAGKQVPLESLDLSQMQQGYGTPHADLSVDGHPLTLAGKVYQHGVGTHSESIFRVNLFGQAQRFTAVVGVDDETNHRGSADFQILANGRKLADSGVLRGGDAPKTMDVPLRGVWRMVLLVTDAGDGIDFDHADWADSVIIMEPGATHMPQAQPPVVEPARMRVLPPNPHPAFHGATVVGATPGRPFLFLLPATGAPPLRYTASSLPPGIRLDPATGILRGTLSQPGTTRVSLTVRGPRGLAREALTIVGGEHTLSLTPPMGWNSWNCWAGAVDQAKVQAAADWMVKSGLAAHGFQYVNIDDTWEGARDTSGAITTNSKFPDIVGLARYVHSKGLKLGIYSSPGPKTCGGYEGSYQHQDQDAATYAKWGIDYLKYDWCSYGDVATGDGLEKLQKPYALMRSSLDKVDRDIVFSFCQYGMGDVWKWGAKTGGNCWRTTGDINDSWGSLYGIYSSQNGHEKYASPGHWNDPDMLVVGKVGWGPSLHPSHLTPNEQILHISMWCMLSAPLLIGCDMSQMDPFTVALLSNDEVLAINQDPLGKPAGRIRMEGDGEVWARPLSDGTKAVALLNSGPDDANVTVTWKELGLSGRQPVRDLWMHRNLGAHAGGITMRVPVHGAIVLKVGHPR